MVPDLFNFLFARRTRRSLPTSPAVRMAMAPRCAPRLRHGWEKPLFYGFLGHNDLWGSDVTAHHASLTLEPTRGYVITKALALHETPAGGAGVCRPRLDGRGGARGLPHLVETAGTGAGEPEPQLGAWMVAAAQQRPSRCRRSRARLGSGLVENAAALGLALSPEQAVGIIVGSETWFRERMIAMGGCCSRTRIRFRGAVLDFARWRSVSESLGAPVPVARTSRL